MFNFLSLVSIVTLSLAGFARAGSSCVAFDVNWNLLALGFNGKDYNAGAKDSWSSGSAADITTTGRPPFDGATTNCYLSQFTNAIYVLGADTSKPSSIYIYDASAKSWSTQEVTTNGFDPTSFSAILDHDTNVFYSLSKNEIFSLDMGLLKSANSSALSWNDVQKPPFPDSYQPVMALAQNHVHFLDVPGVEAGSAVIFVIHFSYMQPEPQVYGDFPATHGQVTSLFKDSGVQKEFVFIPDDGSATYVINVEFNTTQKLTGPVVKDPLATYFASTDSLVQLSSSGTVSYLSYDASAASANKAAAWATISKLPVAVKSSGNGGNSTGNATTTGKSTGSPSGSAHGAAATNGAIAGAALGTNIVGAILFGMAALLL